MMEGALVLAELIRQYRVDLPDAAAEPVLETQLSLYPKGGVRLRLHRRA
jgi:cytochrome P450